MVEPYGQKTQSYPGASSRIIIKAKQVPKKIQCLHCLKCLIWSIQSMDKIFYFTEDEVFFLKTISWLWLHLKIYDTDSWLCICFVLPFSITVIYCKSSFNIWWWLDKSWPRTTSNQRHIEGIEGHDPVSVLDFHPSKIYMRRPRGFSFRGQGLDQRDWVYPREVLQPS